MSTSDPFRRRIRRLCTLPGLLVTGGCVGLLVLASVFAVHARAQSRTDARARARLTALQADPLVKALQKQYGSYRRTMLVQRCRVDENGPEAPFAVLVFPAKPTDAVRLQLTTLVKASGWALDFWQRNLSGDDSYVFDFHRSFGGWTSASNILLDSDGITLELDSADGNACS